jgi:thiamine biosynthesis lipoprotein
MPPYQAFVYNQKGMGTLVTITLWGNDETAAASAAKEAFLEFARLDALMTTWRDDSEVSKINAAAGKKAVPVSDEVFEVIEMAQKVAKATGGAFDITVGAYSGAWKFDEDRDGTIPTAEEVKKRKALVNYRDVQLTRGKQKKVKLLRAGQRITLGGIAKGYAVDRAVAVLHKHGFKNLIVQAGGDLYVGGRRGDRPWRIGIRDPRGPRESSFAVAEIEDKSFSTSGDYERFVMIDNVRYHHILDPDTGYPANRSRSVTVMAKNAFIADAWDTALFVVGVERAMKLLEKLPGVEAVFVDSANKVHISPGLKDRVRLLKQPTDGP